MKHCGCCASSALGLKACASKEGRAWAGVCRSSEVSSRNSSMADMELAAREDDYGDGIEQERGWEERLLTEGVLLELYEVVGDRRR